MGLPRTARTLENGRKSRKRSQLRSLRVLEAEKVNGTRGAPVCWASLRHPGLRTRAGPAGAVRDDEDLASGFEFLLHFEPGPDDGMGTRPSRNLKAPAPDDPDHDLAVLARTDEGMTPRFRKKYGASKIRPCQTSRMTGFPCRRSSP